MTHTKAQSKPDQTNYTVFFFFTVSKENFG